MKAWLIDDLTSGIDQLRIGSVMDPVAGPGEAAVRIKYAALNPADRYLAEGQYPGKPSLPHILGRDAIGTIIEIGKNGLHLSVGDEVVLLRSDVGVSKPGTFAEQVVVAFESLAPAPQNWSAEQSAGAPLVYLTAYQALTCWGELPPSVVLVTGASGGVGVACVQLAKSMGHTVVALSRSRAKRDELERLGAAHTADPADASWPKTVKQLLGARRVDLAIDSVGGCGFARILEVMANRGRISCVGRLAGPVPEFNTASLFFRRLQVGGISIGAFTAVESQAAWKEVLTTLAGGGAVPLVDQVFAFDELPQAFERLKQGPMGKVVLAIS